LYGEGENGDRVTMSYFRLHKGNLQICKYSEIAGCEKRRQSDYLYGKNTEIIIAMLACARIGAIHSVVYGGFSVEALHERIEDSQSKVLIVSDGSTSVGKS